MRTKKAATLKTQGPPAKERHLGGMGEGGKGEEGTHLRILSERGAKERG